MQCLHLSCEPRLCLQCLLQSKPGALHVLGLCCNSFCAPSQPQLRALPGLWYRSRGTHGRSILFPLGNTRYGFVEVGNKLASRMALVMWHGVSHGARFLLEQPSGSQLALHPRVEQVFQAIPCWRVGMWGGAWAPSSAQGTPKRHWLWSNDKMLLRRVEAAAGRLSGEALAALSGPALTKKRKRADGATCWSGDKTSMKASQRPWRVHVRLGACLRTYHERFGIFMAQLKVDMGRADWEVGGVSRVSLNCRRLSRPSRGRLVTRLQGNQTWSSLRPVS